MTDILELSTVLIGLAALFGYLNHRFIGLPRSIGLLVIALAVSLVMLVLNALIPPWRVTESLSAGLGQIDFAETLMIGMLSFLLFAGALHVDLHELLSRKWAIAVMATVGVCLSTAVVGTAMWLVFGALGLDIPLIYALVFGALIAPTDPVAVLGILKTAHIPPSLEAKIAGESLFNDGVGVVVFLILAAIAAGGPGGEAIGAGDVALMFLQEAVGGAVLGLVAGGIAFWAMRGIDEHNLEVLISLALVLIAYELALLWHLSGPIAVVIAGLLIGNPGRRLAMSESTRTRLTDFWSLIDEILNAVLFLLIGLEVLVIQFAPSMLWAGVIAIPIVLIARFVSVGIPIKLLGLRESFTPGTIPVLTWGGLRGGISVALALSLPASAEKSVLVAACYVVVVFSIVVQGLTIGRVVRRVVPADQADLETDHAGR